MIYIIIYFFIILIYFWPFRKENSIRRFILGLYLLSATVSVIKAFVNPGDYPINPVAMLYYIICTLILLFPFRQLGYLNCNNFSLPPKYLSALSYCLIIFGAISWIYTVPKIFTIQTLVNNMSEVRNAYYKGDLIFEGAASIWELLANWVTYIQYLSPFLCIYYFIKENTEWNKIKAILLAIAALTPALNKIIIGEREATIIVFSNFLFAFIFWYPRFTKSQKRTLKLSSLFLVIPFALYVVLMTISRFGEENGVGDSLIVYIGEQPFNYSYFFTSINISDQLLGGKLNFCYFFPEDEWLTESLNYYISSKEYLNVFAAIPGSFLFDFGYYSIFIIFLISIGFYLGIKKKYKKFTFTNFIFYIVYFQIVFMGMFYYDFTTKYVVIMTLFIFLSYFIWHILNVSRSKEYIQHIKQSSF